MTVEEVAVTSHLFHFLLAPPANSPGNGDTRHEILLGVEEVCGHVDNHLVLIFRDL